MKRAESRWLPRLEWFFTFTSLMGLYYLFFREPGNEAQTVFRYSLAFGGGVGYAALQLVKRLGK